MRKTRRDEKNIQQYNNPFCMSLTKPRMAIVLLFVLTIVNSCKSKTQCNCLTKAVCVSLVNSSGQSLENLKLVSYGVDKTSIGKLALNDKACLAFNSTGENTFSLVANLKNGKTIKSTEVYCEDGYKFTAIATATNIKIEYSTFY
jgi:hypothetical protein